MRQPWRGSNPRSCITCARTLIASNIQPNPLPIIGGLGPVKLVRELATLVMLFTVGALAGRTSGADGYMVVAFGVWDIFYYLFLKVMCDWPHSLLDWDILFLIPLPWWGPVLAPVLIALLMIVWGTLATQFERTHPPSLSNWGVWALNFIGVALALYVFMADSIRVSSGGVEALRNVTYLFQLAVVPRCTGAHGGILQIVKLARELWVQRQSHHLELSKQTEIPCKPRRPFQIRANSARCSAAKRPRWQGWTGKLLKIAAVGIPRCGHRRWCRALWRGDGLVA